MNWICGFCSREPLNNVMLDAVLVTWCRRSSSPTRHVHMTNGFCHTPEATQELKNLHNLPDENGI